MDEPVSRRRLSCGIVIVNREAELLLCHVTGHDHWDLPKGGAADHETPREAALRETREETGLSIDPEQLLEIGRVDYRPRKDLHLFAALLPRLDASALRCESRFEDPAGGARLPEMDGFGWFAFEQVGELCTPRLAAVLQQRIDLHRLLVALRHRVESSLVLL
ncbi:MAG: NUDIX domain-containing protein [Rubrivivax sp.]|jgi:8-oxo-dGTP pyrophosphatase MutT (NUDIX family)|nr:NUDIX domain-containing protein [Rubrivivax sp.]